MIYSRDIIKLVMVYCDRGELVCIPILILKCVGLIVILQLILHFDSESEFRL